jgi:HTH-type transcriptional regulator/antitoxin HigA
MEPHKHDKTNVSKINPIKTEQDYSQALMRLEKIFDAEPGTMEGDELEILGTIIEHSKINIFP